MGRRRRHRDEPQPFEDRTAIVGGVDLDVAAAARGGVLRPVGDERAVDPAPAPSRQREAAPERRELRTRWKSHPAVADGATACLRNEDAETLRIGRTLFGEAIDPAVVLVRHRLVKLHEPREVAWLAHLSDE